MSRSGQPQKGAQRIEELIAKFESVGDPGIRLAAAELVDWLLELHGSGLARMLEIVADTAPAGEELVSRLGRDDLVAQLLMLHGLHPVDLTTRVTEALEKVRPYLAAHGGDVELVDVSGGLVRLRLQGSCNGCPSSALTLQNAIEEAVYQAAADISGLEVLGVVPEPRARDFVPLETIGLKEALARIP
jgi:Fe-S cluster biogenesis protein NfuA